MYIYSRKVWGYLNGELDIDRYVCMQVTGMWVVESGIVYRIFGGWKKIYLERIPTLRAMKLS